MMTRFKHLAKLVVVTMTSFDLSDEIPGPSEVEKIPPGGKGDK